MEKNPMMFSYNFFVDKKKIFKKKEQPPVNFLGNPLNSYLELDVITDLVEILEYKNISTISDKIYIEWVIFLHKNFQYIPYNKHIHVVLYSVAKCENFNILFIFFLKSKYIIKNKNTVRRFYRSYGVDKHYCCLKTIKPELITKIDNLPHYFLCCLSKECVFPTKYFDLYLVCMPYLFNSNDLNVKKAFDSIILYSSITADNDVGGHLSSLYFLYNQNKKSPPLCKNLYTNLDFLFLKDFFHDFLFTVLNYQNSLLKSYNLIKNQFLYLTLKIINE
uniref:Uncharacterized protein orf275 n=1 Tax=Parachlorella kessleri TaxID=3074 RepID=C7BEZ3_PARKE|nr:hypothetical protein PakeC_p061 [Parachlorella kessleri]ACQ90988.1 hypothetical protein [Parachlorella kessleri]